MACHKGFGFFFFPCESCGLGVFGVHFSMPSEAEGCEGMLARGADGPEVGSSNLPPATNTRAR